MQQQLPIFSIQAEFLQKLSEGNVVVEASTGSGKSTCLPLWSRAHGRVLVIEPRRLACVSLARFLSQQEKNIGYAIRFKSHYDNDSQVVFATPGIVLRWLAEDQLKQFDVVILDEFHERRADTDLIAAVLKKINRHRLVVTSATVEGKRLANYFQAELLQAKGKMHELSIEYSEQLQLPTTRKLVDRVYDGIKKILPSSQGDILIFLPGKAEIQKTEQFLQSKLSHKILPLHAGVDEGIQDAALNTSKQIRIILATNVAETSVTLPGVRSVIDSGLEKRTHHRNGRTVLGMHAISQASAQQRAGRAGRLGPGKVLRLWGRQNKLEAFTPPEVLREELTELILAAASINYAVDELQFADNLPEHAVIRDTQFLQKIGALNDEEKITPYGRALFPLPIDTLFAHLISAMQSNSTKEAMIDLCSALSTQRALLPALKPDQYEALKDWLAEDCDMQTLIKVMREKPPKGIPVDNRVLKEARNISQQLRNHLKLPELSSSSAFDRHEVLAQSISAAPELAFVRREKRPESLGNGYMEVEIGRESRFAEEAQAAVVFDQHSIPGKGTLKTINYASCMAPISLAQLHKLPLGEMVYTEPKIKNGSIQVLKQHHYAGRCIHSEIMHPKGDTLCDVLAKLILQGQLLPPLGQRISTDIHAWNLYLSLPETQTEGSQMDPFDWLRQVLKDLGVTSMQEFSIITEDDIQFSGIPEWERKAFDEKFPLSLQLENLIVKVEYELEKKNIILRYEKGARKKAPLRKELPRWPGWKLFYQYGQKCHEIN